MKFPKFVYVAQIEEDDDDDSEFFIDTDKDAVSDREEDGTEVAVYELVKIGAVKRLSKIVFE